MASELYTGYTDISKNLQEMASQRSQDQYRAIQSASTIQDMEKQRLEEEERQQKIQRLMQYSNPQMVPGQVPGMVEDPNAPGPMYNAILGKDAGVAMGGNFVPQPQSAQVPGMVPGMVKASMAPATLPGEYAADVAWRAEQEAIKKSQLEEYNKVSLYAKSLYLDPLQKMDVSKDTKKKIYESVKSLYSSYDNPYLKNAAASLDPESMASLDIHDRPSGAGAGTGLRTIKTRDKDGKEIIVTEEKLPDGTWKEKATADRFSPQSGFGMSGYIQSKTVPGVSYSRKDGRAYYDETNENGEIVKKPMDTASVQQQTIYWTPQMKKLQQQGGIRAVNAYVAADTYKSEASELLAIRDRIAKNNPSLFSGIGSDLRAVNNISQWAKMNTSDDPDLAEFIKGTTLLADVLMNAVGGAQGGQWAFELASKLLDPSLPREAYQSTIDKHMRTLEEKAKNYGQLGTNKNSTSYVEKPKLPGESTKPLGQSMQSFIDAAVSAGYTKDQAVAHWKKKQLKGGK